MRNRTFTAVVIAALLATVFVWVACGANSNGDQPAANQQTSNTPANSPTNEPEDDPAEETEKPDEPEESEPAEELGDVPTGELEDHGLVFPIPFERGEGSAVFSRQNDYLRVELDVRLPYTAGNGQRDRGSSVDLVLSVDGLHGRHLFFYPQPLWFPTGQGRVSTYHMEASYSADKDGPPSVVNNPSFVGEGDVAYWDRWTAVLWVDLRLVLVPGNSPGSVADSWHAGLIVGSEVAMAELPQGLDKFNPGKTPDRLLQFKYSELPELDELDEDPKERIRAREKEVHDHMKGVDALAVMQNHKGMMERLNKVLETYDDELWAHNLRAKVSYLGAMNGLEGVDKDYLKFHKEYIDAGPGQSAVHLEYLQDLIRADKYETAKQHAGRIFDSGMCTGRALTDGRMRLEWAKLCVQWGFTKEAKAQLDHIEAQPDILEDNELRLQFKLCQADLASRRADSTEALAIYDAIVKEEHEHLTGEQTQQIQQLGNIQRAATEHWQKELELRESDAAKTNPRLVIETAKGKIVVELFEDDAPNTTASLVSLAQKSFWDGLNFHRVEPNFVAQGGCPNGDGSGGPGYRTRFERNQRRHFRGSFAMARSQDQDSQGSQFYICVSNGPSVLTLSDNNYLVVGRVIEGMDVADMLRVGDKIISIKAENLRDHEYKPETLPE